MAKSQCICSFCNVVPKVFQSLTKNLVFIIIHKTLQILNGKVGSRRRSWVRTVRSLGIIEYLKEMIHSGEVVKIVEDTIGELK